MKGKPKRWMRFAEKAIVARQFSESHASFLLITHDKPVLCFQCLLNLARKVNTSPVMFHYFCKAPTTANQSIFRCLSLSLSLSLFFCCPLRKVKDLRLLSCFQEPTGHFSSSFAEPGCSAFSPHLKTTTPHSTLESRVILVRFILHSPDPL